MRYTDRVMHHIGNANEFHIVGDVYLPLPCILYGKEGSFDVFMSSAFEHGHKAVKGYVLDHSVVKRIVSPEHRGVEHIDSTGVIKNAEGHEVPVAYAHGEVIELERPSTLIKSSSWIDFSISKNVFSMLLSVIILFVIFGIVSKSYKGNIDKAPKGLQGLIEPIIIFLRDDVVKPSIGKNYEKYFPYILTVFFFILVNNLLGLIPFFPGSANVTGNVGTTLALAVFTFIIVNVSANKHYWQHVLWMPGIPAFVKIILTPVEIAGLFIKPFTLFIRLFANITAGHIIILSLIGLIFMFGKNGESLPGSIGGIALAVPFVFMMNFLELLVAFLQAFIFALLSSIYIGSAIEEHHEAHH